MSDWGLRVPEPQDYVALRSACGLGPRSLDGARVGLQAGLVTMTLYDGNRLLGMGRVVGDGGCFVQLVDIAIHPSIQGLGHGAEVTRRLVAWCEANLPPTCHVSLVSSARAIALYAAQGFSPCRGMDRYADPDRSPTT